MSFSDWKSLAMFTVVVHYQQRLSLGPEADSASPTVMRLRKVKNRQWTFARGLEDVERSTARAFPQAQARFWVARRECDTEESDSPVGPRLVAVARGQEIRDTLPDLHNYLLKRLRHVFSKKPRPKELTLATCHIDKRETVLEGQVWDEGDEWDLMEELELEDFVPLSVEDPFAKETPDNKGVPEELIPDPYTRLRGRFRDQSHRYMDWTKRKAMLKWLGDTEAGLWGPEGVLTQPYAA